MRSFVTSLSIAVVIKFNIFMDIVHMNIQRFNEVAEDAITRYIHRIVLQAKSRDKEILKLVLGKNTLQAMLLSGVTLDKWVNGETERHWSSSGETIFGNYMGDLTTAVISAEYGKACMKNLMKNIDAYYYDECANKYILMQIKSADKHSPKIAKEAFVTSMAAHEERERERNKGKFWKVFGHTGGKYIDKCKKMYGHEVKIWGGDCFWKKITDIDECQEKVIIPIGRRVRIAMDSHIDEAKEYIRDLLREEALKYKNSDGTVDIINLYRNQRKK